MSRNLKSLLMILAAISAIALGCCVQKPEPPARKLSLEDGCVIAPKEIFEQMVKRLKERGA